VLGSVARYAELPCKVPWCKELKYESKRSWDEFQHINTVDGSSKLRIFSKHKAHAKKLSHQFVHGPMNAPFLLWDASQLGWGSQPRKTGSITWLHCIYIEVLMRTETTLPSGLVHRDAEELCCNVFVLQVVCTMFCAISGLHYVLCSISQVFSSANYKHDTVSVCIWFA